MGAQVRCINDTKPVGSSRRVIIDEAFLTLGALAASGALALLRYQPSAQLSAEGFWLVSGFSQGQRHK